MKFNYDVEEFDNCVDDDLKEFNRYTIECEICNYKWQTKYNKIPARCPSCNSKLYQTSNYKIIGLSNRIQSQIEADESYGKVFLTLFILFVMFIWLSIYFGVGWSFLIILIIGILIIIFNFMNNVD